MIYIITGTSSGIGKALAYQYLQKGEYVIGISRSNFIKHKRFSHIKCDLAEKQQLHNLSLLPFASKENYPICLINNAGIIGDIKRCDQLTLTHYVDMAMVNITAPQFLCSYVLQTFGFKNVSTIINITSGAGKYPVPSWAAYCASKAAINLFAETIQEEIKELGEDTKIFNLAPGVVDTKMQEMIRNSKPTHFSKWREFVELKEKEELRSPKEVALLIDDFIKNPPSEEEGIIHRV